MTTFLDDETLTLYIEESKEHLDTIETDLLELEKQGENFDEELVNKVFRAAHSIKGGGGFLGLNTIKELAHRIENLLHLIRTKQLTPNSSLINILLNAYDRLSELINNPADSNNADISEHISKLEKAISGDQDQALATTSNREFVIKHPKLNITFKIKEFDLNQSRQGGKQIYILDFDLMKDVHKQNKTPFDVINLLEDSGQIIDVQTDIASCGDLSSEIVDPIIPMCTLFSSIVEPELVGIMFNLKDGQINQITNDLIKPVSAENAEIPAVAPAEPVAAVVENTPAPPAPEIKQEAPSEAKPVEAPQVKKAEAKQEKAADISVKQPSTISETLRVNVSVLDQLMNRAGELVLARNQMMQAIQSWDRQSVTAAGQRMDLVTSELQETIMLTRMQPVGIVFNKFPRVVRGLAMDLGKKIDLQLIGSEVELDKTIIEGLADPLTHLVRNSADHGIELPDEREKKGKPATGKIILKAFYESGQVQIEITDDGKGLDPEKIAQKAISKGLYSTEEIEEMSDKEKFNLIMLPGFSTAEKVTDVSGRGVGMDVVKTNLDNLGGQVELVSEVDRGTTIRIKLPLTLAIIPSLLAQASEEWYALPQANVSELLRIPAAEVRERVEKIGEADVLLLRGELIPLLQLNNVLGLKPTYYDYKTGTFEPDRRSGLVDQRISDDSENPPLIEAEIIEEELDDNAEERRKHRGSDVVVVILNDGSQKYGLIVDSVSDSVEIVVKPLGRHLAHNKAYAGATIMGDGHVALILDAHGLTELAELKPMTDGDQEATQETEELAVARGATRQTLLIFHNGPDEACAVPLGQVLRVEQIKADDIEIKGGKKIIQYRGGSLTVYALEEVASVEMLEAREKLIVIIFEVAGNEVGLLAVQPLDVVDQDLILDDRTLRQPGIAGSTIINGKTTLLVDIFELIKIVNPTWFEDSQPAAVASTVQPEEGKKGEQILLIEDSQFFRNQVKRFIEDAGYDVIEAEDGKEAWDYIDANPDTISLVVTDLEMPNMDGFEFTRRFKSDNRFEGIPVIALTSLAGEPERNKGKEVGIDDYQLKLDKEKLMESIQQRFGK